MLIATKISEWVRRKMRHGMDHHHEKLCIPHSEGTQNSYNHSDELEQHIVEVSPMIDLRCVLAIGTLGNSHDYDEMLHGHEFEVEHVEIMSGFEHKNGGDKNITSLKEEEDLMEPFLSGQATKGSVVEKERMTLAELFAESDETERREVRRTSTGFASKFLRRWIKESSGENEEKTKTFMVVELMVKSHWHSDEEDVPLKKAGEKKPRENINAPHQTKKLENASEPRRIRRLICKMAGKKIHPEAASGSKVTTCRQEVNAKENRERNCETKKERSSSKSSTTLPWPLQCHGLPQVAP